MPAVSSKTAGSSRPAGSSPHSPQESAFPTCSATLLSSECPAAVSLEGAEAVSPASSRVEVAFAAMCTACSVSGNGHRLRLQQPPSPDSARQCKHGREAAGRGGVAVQPGAPLVTGCPCRAGQGMGREGGELLPMTTKRPPQSGAHHGPQRAVRACLCVMQVRPPAIGTAHRWMHVSRYT